MNNRFFFDSSFLFALYFDDDFHHNAAVTRFDTIISEDCSFYTNEDVIKEIITLIAYKYKKSFSLIWDILAFIDDLDIVIVSYDFELYIKHYLLLWKKISFQDSTILLDTMRLQCSLLTFDTDLQKIALNTQKDLFY